MLYMDITLPICAWRKSHVDGEEEVGFAIDAPNVDVAGQEMPAVVAVAVEKF